MYQCQGIRKINLRELKHGPTSSRTNLAIKAFHLCWENVKNYLPFFSSEIVQFIVLFDDC